MVRAWCPLVMASSRLLSGSRCLGPVFKVGVSGPARCFSAAPGQADTRRRTGTRICDFTGLMEPEMQSTASPHPGSRPRPRHRVPLWTMPWSAGPARRRRVVAHLLFEDDKQTTKQAHARFSFSLSSSFRLFFFSGIHGETVIRPIGLIDN
ncbi:uncharacterized protein B0T23DRAFT_34318 [Neurospora hispaniola]|uniref:Uncharacterized protein n=1 Tax=Neurospora hispaniola TaxID=588809 RepID=A0AAJ0IGV4_9PEZI|nr:hypothetical protein B0T23DRAFT_34318 [Neurospora hispaniola]